MIELIAVYLLARRNGEIVEEKGYRGTAYRWGTVGLWFGGEITGAVVGAALLGHNAEEMAVYACALLGAIIGGAAACYWAGQTPIHPSQTWNPTHLSPPTGLVGWEAPDPTQQPLVLLPPNVDLMVLGAAGDWAMVRAVNSWVGWVDARQLLPKPSLPVFPGPPSLAVLTGLSGNPHAPHAFMERPNLPLAIPCPTGPQAGQLAPEVPVAWTGSAACAICGRPRSDRLHAGSEQQAEQRRWPI
jgi:hypothetical protein